MRKTFKDPDFPAEFQKLRHRRNLAVDAGRAGESHPRNAPRSRGRRGAEELFRSRPAAFALRESEWNNVRSRDQTRSGSKNFRTCVRELAIEY